jgi:hypothetical protein
MTLASILEVFEDETTRGRGEHKFAALPSRGDLIFLSPGMAPWNDVLEVLTVEHRPVQIPSSVYANLTPTVTIRVRHVGEERFED